MALKHHRTRTGQIRPYQSQFAVWTDTETALYVYMYVRCGLGARHLDTVYCVMGWNLAYGETPVTTHH